MPMLIRFAGLLIALALASCVAAQSAVEVGGAASQLVSAEVGLDAGTEADEISEDAGAESVTEAAAANDADHDDPADYVWEEADVIPIALNGDSISADSDGVAVEGSRATISAAGTYRLSGSLADGQIVVDTEDESIVRLILSGVDLHNSTGAPIYIVSAEKVLIVLTDGTDNHISDGETYVFEDPDEDEPNAAIFSKADLTISGEGSLAVEGRYNDGIASKDGLIVASGNVTVDAVDDGIRGKDYLVVRGGA
ncbi:MAG: carbohydrate-binding domain-containing protein, partial [Chloroflexota bacterium]